jgi:hypothetical protein
MNSALTPLDPHLQVDIHNRLRGGRSQTKFYYLLRVKRVDGSMVFIQFRFPHLDGTNCDVKSVDESGQIVDFQFTVHGLNQKTMHDTCLVATCPNGWIRTESSSLYNGVEIREGDVSLTCMWWPHPLAVPE